MCLPVLRAISEDLPEDFGDLLADSLAGGHPFLQRLQSEWLSGSLSSSG